MNKYSNTINRDHYKQNIFTYILSNTFYGNTPWCFFTLAFNNLCDNLGLHAVLYMYLKMNTLEAYRQSFHMSSLRTDLTQFAYDSVHVEYNNAFQVLKDFVVIVKK